MSNLEQILKQDKQVDWELFISRHRESSPLFNNLVIASQYPKGLLLKTLGINFAFNYFKRVGDSYFWSSKEREKLKKLLKLESRKNPIFLERVIKRASQNCDQLNRFCQQLKTRENFNNKTNKELSELFNNYWLLLTKTASFIVVKHVLNRVLEKSIKDKLALKLSDKDKVNLCFENFLVPANETLISRANKELRRLASLNKVEDRAMMAFLNKYSWVETFNWRGKLLTKSDVKRKIVKLKKEIIKIIRPDSFAWQTEFKKYFSNDKRLLAEIKLLQYLLYFHTYQLECLFSAHYHCQNLLGVVANRIRLSFVDLSLAIYPEIIAGLSGKEINIKGIPKRKNNRFCLYRFKDQLAVFEGKEFGRLKNKGQINVIKVSELKGKIAFQGKVRGKAKIIMSVKDFNKFKKGDILISPMTTVDFNPYLNKVAAIVTDEGGITCHASIISRELGVPCIIGTKIATKVFKDGDLVEVNAHQGIIKKI